ncbi:Atu4866 domain-containing protein [Marisediminicola sp. LYQ85]|uniref:Atu4866 domain-containing protein n=1 Tax=Marisediminicola sp. LYQ85 TaxID=3391062 RepID=UPI003983462F
MLLGGSRVVGIGPGLLSAADDDGAIVIDCDGYVLVPAAIDAAQRAGLRDDGFRSPFAIAPGNPATFALIPALSDETSADTALRLLDAQCPVPVLVVDGVVTRWDGSAVGGSVGGSVEGTNARDAEIDPQRLGTWIDENDFVHQHLTGDGRYDETRGGREHAYQGDFWITGTRIDYRDDLGFWAFGEFVDGVLQHAGYTFRRATAPTSPAKEGH